MKRYLCWVLALASMFGSTSCGARVRNDLFAPAEIKGTVGTDLLTEASGLAASRKNPGVLWAHNDSGDSPRIFALDAQANLLGICEITGAEARDWEDIAAGPGPDPNRHYLYIGDIGDNNGQFPSVKIYRIAEPDVNAIEPFGQMRLGPAETIELTYPDGPRDAETLLVDPLTKDIYLVSKRDLLGHVYRAAYPQSTTTSTRLEPVAVLPWTLATAGDISPDGREIIVRGMHNASLWDRPADEPLWHAFSGPQTGLPLADEPQGEAITFDSTGQGYFTLSEGTNPPLYYFAQIDQPNQ